MLSKNTALKTLNIANNRIGNTGITALSKGLEQSDTIHELNLSGNDFEGPGMSALLKALPECSSIQKLFLMVRGNYFLKVHI